MHSRKIIRRIRISKNIGKSHALKQVYAHEHNHPSKSTLSIHPKILHQRLVVLVHLLMIGVVGVTIISLSLRVMDDWRENVFGLVSVVVVVVYVKVLW